MVGFKFRQTNLGGGVGGGVYLHRVGRGGVVRFYLHKLFGWLHVALAFICVVFFIYFICVLHLLHLCSSFTLCVCHIVFCIYCVCFLNLFYLSAVLFSTFIVFVFFNIVFMLSISIYVCTHTHS